MTTSWVVSRPGSPRCRLRTSDTSSTSCAHRLESETLREFAPPLVEEAAIEELRKDADPVRLREDRSESAATRHPDEGTR